MTFKYGLGEELIGVLKTLHKLGLDSTAPVQVGKAAVSPRDVVAACLPDPAGLGDAMWSGTGVLGPEALPAEPFLEVLNSHGAPWECEHADLVRERIDGTTGV